MSNILISIVASANRVKWWERFYNSLTGNKLNWEIIFVGDTPPLKKMPDNFKWIKAIVKPAQCYEIGFRASKGELIHWTADDADYNHPTRNCPNSLDIAYAHWQEMEKRYNNDKKSVVAFRPIEDGGDVYRFHHYFGGWEETPVMAPFALIHRDYFVNKLGGYDKRFVSGQSENDVIMRVYEDGGRVDICMNAFIYIHHRQVHPRDNKGKEDNKFRQQYNVDREILENCWVIGGYGFYEKLNRIKGNTEARKSVKISKTRLLPLERFEDKDITTITQGPKGIW